MALYFPAKKYNVLERPFHRAFLSKTIPCPHGNCKDRINFKSKNGIDHHYRSIHRIPLSQAEINQLKVVRPNNEKETLGGNTYI